MEQELLDKNLTKKKMIEDVVLLLTIENYWH